MHHTPGPQDDHQDADLRIIRREVKAFLRDHAFRWSDENASTFRWSDEDDLVQECALRWLRVAVLHDPDRASRTTFLKRVVRNHLTDLWRSEQASVRKGHAGALSIEAPLGGEDERTLGDAVPSYAPGPARTAAWNLSLARILEQLSGRQRAVVKGVLDGYSLVELTRELGVHRDTLYQDRKRIQEVFWQEGLAPRGFDPTDRNMRS